MPKEVLAKIHASVKSPFWRPLSRQRLPYFLKHVFADRRPNLLAGSDKGSPKSSILRWHGFLQVPLKAWAHEMSIETASYTQETSRVGIIAGFILMHSEKINKKLVAMLNSK